jgi:hypothetical protein
MDLPKRHRFRRCNSHIGYRWQNYIDRSGLHQVRRFFLYTSGTYAASNRATKAHTGAYLAARIAECVRDYGIENKVQSNYFK